MADANPADGSGERIFTGSFDADLAILEKCAAAELRLLGKTHNYFRLIVEGVAESKVRSKPAQIQGWVLRGEGEPWLRVLGRLEVAIGMHEQLCDPVDLSMMEFHGPYGREEWTDGRDPDVDERAEVWFVAKGYGMWSGKHKITNQPSLLSAASVQVHYGIWGEDKRGPPMSLPLAGLNGAMQDAGIILDVDSRRVYMLKDDVITYATDLNNVDARLPAGPLYWAVRGRYRDRARIFDYGVAAELISPGQEFPTEDRLIAYQQDDIITYSSWFEDSGEDDAGSEGANQ